MILKIADDTIWEVVPNVLHIDLEGVPDFPIRGVLSKGGSLAQLLPELEHLFTEWPGTEAGRAALVSLAALEEFGGHGELDSA